jgi:hypothetical protein
MSLEFAGLIREGFSQDSFYGDEGEWTKGSRIEAKAKYFWRLDRLCIPRNFELRLRVIKERTTVCHLVTHDLLALLLKRSTDLGGNEFAKT